MPTSKKVQAQIGRASFIRKMFEEGNRLRSELGAENVYDFTLGNPQVEPPEALGQTLAELVADPRPGLHRYMPNAGYPDVRARIAEHLSRIHGRDLGVDHVVMTVGAAGALNCVLKAILDPGDEVMVVAPYFPEYSFYIDNHQGTQVVVESDEDFRLVPERFEAALTERTRAVIINSPNNPTGRIYSLDNLRALGEVLRRGEERFGRPIYLLSDEPYRAVTYGGRSVPSLFDVHCSSVVCTSHSKDLAIPGERIGYAAVNPDCPGSAELYGAMAFTNRILGYVNAPALMQRAVARLQGQTVDPEVYRRRRDLLLDGLRAAGMPVEEPDGAFYLFPKTPIPDDEAFCAHLRRFAILLVPGVGFARPGHVRLSYCVDEAMIERSVPRFAEALAQL